jgi:amino acid transporter
LIARVHPRYRTPANAIVITACIALALALSGSFVKLAAVSAVARLVAYAGTAGATLRLRRLELDKRVAPAGFVIPFGSTVPILALLTSALILVGGSAEQLGGGAAALLAGAALFWAAHRKNG